MSVHETSIEGARLKLYSHAPRLNGVQTSAVGGFRCDDPAAGAALLTEACKRSTDFGAQAVIGPMDGNTWHSYRLVTESDGSAPFLLEPTSGEHDLAAFEQAGFAPVARYFSAKVQVSEALLSPVPPDGAIRVEQWDGADPRERFTEIFELSCRSFAENAFYTPISLNEFLALYLPMVPLMKRELIFFAYNDEGELAGFLFGAPNYAEGPKPRSVILKTYASLQRGAGRVLSHAFHKAVLELKFEQVIHALIHEDNLSGARSRMHGAKVFRRYALMGRTLG